MVLDPIDNVNACQIQEMRRALIALDPSREDSSGTFNHHVKNIEAMVVHTYNITAHTAVRSPSSEAAELWKKYIRLCDSALSELQTAKEKFPSCETEDLYSLTFRYREAGNERYQSNLMDAECQKNPLQIADLFPSPS